MITLFTGLPGNAKTLKVLQWLQKRALAENRDVYYSGVNECRVPSQLRADGTMSKPWQEFDPKEWMALPDGALIFIDEAQDTFDKRPNGSALPEYFKMLAKHRHTGKDIVLATQHPSLIDNFPRKLIQQHFHAIRKFGMKRSTYYEWDKVSDFPERISSQKSAVSTEKFVFPKEIFDWYTSASLHTVKRRVPMKLILAVLLVLVVGAYAVYTFMHFGHRGDAKVAPSVAAGAVGDVKSGGDGHGSLPFDPVADARHFVEMSTPRIVGLPQTAPKYDELTKPSRVPVPAMCIQRDVNCKCWTQQATPMDVPLNMCIEFARNGFFEDFDPQKEKAASDRTARGAEALDKSPVGRSAPLSNTSQILSIPDLTSPPAAPAGPPVDVGVGRRPGAGNAAQPSSPVPAA